MVATVEQRRDCVESLLPFSTEVKPTQIFWKLNFLFEFLKLYVNSWPFQTVIQNCWAHFDDEDATLLSEVYYAKGKWFLKWNLCYSWGNLVSKSYFSTFLFKFSIFQRNPRMPFISTLKVWSEVGRSSQLMIYWRRKDLTNLAGYDLFSPSVRTTLESKYFEYFFCF